MVSFGIFYYYYVQVPQQHRYCLYDKSKTWEFMGQTVNWIKPGWKRYFYSLFRPIFITSDTCVQLSRIPTVYSASANINFSFYLLECQKNINLDCITIDCFCYCFGYYLGFICIVIAASLLYHSTAIVFSKFFMYIVLTAAIHYFFKTQTQKYYGIYHLFLHS